MNKTPGISGHHSGTSSLSETLQSRLESRLRVNLAEYGSPEYALTWKHWAMKWGGGDLCAAGVSAPETRQRLYWMGNPHGKRTQGRRLSGDRLGKQSPWASGVGVLGSDKTRRRIEPGIWPVAYGFSDRVAWSRCIGNAIVPELAAAFIVSCDQAIRL